MKNQKGFAVIEAILILIIVAMIGGVVWYVIKQNKDTAEPTNSAVSKTEKETIEEYKAKTTVPDDWQTYENEEYKISFAYPAKWKVGVLETEPDGTESISANASKLVLFSINSPNAVQSTDVSMRAYDIPAQQSVEQMKEDNENLNKQLLEGEPHTLFSSKEITFQGKKGFEVTIKQPHRDSDEVSTMVYYLVEFEGYTFALPYIEPDILDTSGEDPTNLNYISQVIVDSIKFL